MSKPLPPDPEAMNDSRAEWAGTALQEFQRLTATEDEDALGDLLVDLMHWCDRNDPNFELALSRARGHYEAETTATPIATGATFSGSAGGSGRP